MTRCDECKSEFEELMADGLCVSCFSLSEIRAADELALVRSLLLWPEKKRDEFIRLYNSSDIADNNKSAEILFEALSEIEEE